MKQHFKGLIEIDKKIELPLVLLNDLEKRLLSATFFHIHEIKTTIFYSVDPKKTIFEISFTIDENCFNRDFVRGDIEKMIGAFFINNNIGIFEYDQVKLVLYGNKELIKHTNKAEKSMSYMGTDR